MSLLIYAVTVCSTKMLLLAQLLIASLLSFCAAEVFYVNATHPAFPNQDCPQPCHTLNQYAQNTSLFSGHTNISLVFLKGDHILNSTLNIDGVKEISLQPQADKLKSENVSVVVRGVKRSDMITFTGQTIAIYKLKIEGIDTIQLGQGPFPTLSGSALATFLSIRKCVIKYGGISLGPRPLPSEASDFHAEITDSCFEGPSEDTLFMAQYSTGVTAFFTGNLTLDIHNCSFTHYQFGFYLYRVLGSMTVTITKTRIFNNTIAGLFINDNLHSNATFQNKPINYNFTVEETQVYSNDLGVTLIQFPSSNIDKHTKQGTVPFSKGTIIIRNCNFSTNRGSPILAYQSSFELVEENIFHDNTAERGAGLALYSSTVHFGSHSNTTFVNNTASKYGGAIYISSLPPITPAVLTASENWQKEAFIILTSQFAQPCFYSSDSEANVVFSNNKAELGGIDIFGPARSADKKNVCKIENSDIFNFSDPELQVTSNPTRVCFCVDNVPQCENKTYLILNETRYPGESFNTSVVLVGYEFGQVSGPIYTEPLDSRNGVIGDNQYVQNVDYKQCNYLTYTVTSDQTKHPVYLALTAQEQQTDENRDNEVRSSLRNLYSDCKQQQESCTLIIFITSVYIQVTLDSCPLGFALNKTSGACNCDVNLGKIRNNDQMVVKCEIQDHNGYITRRGTVWVGVDTRENNTDIYYWHRFCPRDYCIRSKTSIDLRYPDKQCSKNRSGLLCGKCQAGYSLQLGGNKCIECNNNYSLALLFVFAVLGILLVAFIKLLDLTVSSATINGLIFYANIVWTNNAVLFPKQSIGYYIITVPIAWINLDYGIETCLSENLDQGYSLCSQSTSGALLVLSS